MTFEKILIFFQSYAPCNRIIMKSCQKDISKIVGAKALKLGELIGDDE